MKHIIKAQADYIKFLSDEIERTAGYASAHGIGCSDETYQEGIKLRAGIESAQKGFGDLNIFAEELFAHQIGNAILEDKLHERIHEIMDIDDDLYEDVSYDYYDHSFELHGTNRSWISITPEQKAKFKALGFSRCWFNYSDGTEKHFVF